MANSLDWNVCYHGKDFVYLVSYLLAVSYGSMNACLVTRSIPKANNDMTQLSQPGKNNVKIQQKCRF